MSFEYKDEYKYLSSACLNLTDDCNLACKYCFVAQQPHYMSLETAKQAVDFLVNNLRIKKEKGYISEKAKTDITYFGGEPTLMWDSIIVPLTKYIKETYPNEVGMSITTNGTLLNKERIDFLYDNGIGVLLSIDGAKETQDFNRPCKHGKCSSFDLVIKNIPYLLEKFPDITFRSTIYAPTVEHTFENYVYATYLGFKNIFMVPNSRDKWTDKQKEILREQVQKIALFIANSFNKNLVPIDFSSLNDAFERVLQHDIKVYNKEPNEKVNNSRGCKTCGLGTTFGSIGYNGDIYGCQEQDSKGEKSKFYLGNIKTGINEQLHTNLLAEYTQKTELNCENPELCKNCKLKNICFNHACPSSSQDLFHSFFIDSEIHCLWTQYLFENAAIILRLLTERNNLLFKKYLMDKCRYSNYFTEEEENEL